MPRLDLTAKNLDGAWRRVHRWIWPIFVALYGSASFLLISGEWSVNRWLEDADLEHGVPAALEAREGFSETVGGA